MAYWQMSSTTKMPPLFLQQGSTNNLTFCTALIPQHNPRTAFACFKEWQFNLHEFNESTKTMATCGNKPLLFKGLFFFLITPDPGFGLHTKHRYTYNQKVWHLSHWKVVFFGGKNLPRRWNFISLLIDDIDGLGDTGMRTLAITSREG